MIFAFGSVGKFRLGCANDRTVQLRHLYRQNQLIKRMEKAAASN